jgi:hypothetical protein
MIDRFVSLLVAVSLALLVWLYARSREQELLDNVTVPVEVSVAPRQAENYSLELTGPPQITLSFSGPPARIRELHGMLQRKELHVSKVLTVPGDKLDEARYSEAVVVEPGDVNAPLGVQAILKEGKSRIPFVLHRLIEKPLPVRFEGIQEGPPGAVVIDPPVVRVRGPREVLDRATFIRTQASDVPAMNSPGSYAAVGRVAIDAVVEGRPVRVTPPNVTVRVPARKLYELTEVPVHFMCPENFHLKPKFIDERVGKVALKLYGPAQDEPPKVYAFIDLTRGKFTSGLNHEPLQLQLPKDFALAKEAPRVVAFELLPGDFVPDGLGMPPAAPAPVPAGR